MKEENDIRGRKVEREEKEKDQGQEENGEG